MGKLKRIGTVLLSGCCVYVFMAACGSRVDSTSSGGASSSGTSSSSASSSGSAGGPNDSAPGLVDAIIDSLTDPIPEASAAPPDVATEPCDKVGTCAGGQTCYFAAHAYPGKTVQDLALLHVTGHTVASAGVRYTIGADTYEYQQALAALRPGFAIVYCGTGGLTQYDSVTFTLP